MDLFLGFCFALFCELSLGKCGQMPEKKQFWKDGISALAYSSSRIWFIREGCLVAGAGGC